MPDENLVVEPQKVRKPQTKRLVAPHTAECTNVGDRISYSSEFLRRIDQDPHLLRRRRNHLPRFERRQFKAERWICEGKPSSQGAGPLAAGEHGSQQCDGVVNGFRSELVLDHSTHGGVDVLKAKKCNRNRTQPRYELL